MALRNQPYLPLYVQDLLTDEKLIECSALAHGVYLRLICILHKQKEYGTILLKQKYKQDESNINNFAYMFTKQMPFDFGIIKEGLHELINEDVIQINSDKLYQKRMVRDNEISLKRAESGKKGGLSKKKKSAKAKTKANTENESEYEIEFDNVRKLYPGTKRGLETEFNNFKKKHKDWKEVLPLLKNAIEKQKSWRFKRKVNKQFTPEWQKFQTWINQRSWEMELIEEIPDDKIYRNESKAKRSGEMQSIRDVINSPKK